VRVCVCIYINKYEVGKKDLTVLDILAPPFMGL